MQRHRKTNRLQDYDYSSSALYFITSCVHKVNCRFGEIVGGKMILNDLGKIADRQLHWLKEQYPYIHLDASIVMPNHIHAIIEIDRKSIAKDDVDVVTGRDLSLHPIKIKHLSEIVGAYKTTSSKQIHLLGHDDFRWQRSFHDHIIRNEQSYLTIRKYIENNASNWPDDKFFAF